MFLNSLKDSEALTLEMEYKLFQNYFYPGPTSTTAWDSPPVLPSSDTHFPWETKRLEALQGKEAGEEIKVSAASRFRKGAASVLRLTASFLPVWP